MRNIKVIRRFIYQYHRFFDKIFGGHLSIGNITVYGRNAMNHAINIRTKRWGCICFRLPITLYGKWDPLYFYLSPNGTPWASTFYVGSSRRERKLSRLRKDAFGHGFNSNKWKEELSYINNYEKISDKLLRDKKIESLF